MKPSLYIVFYLVSLVSRKLFLPKLELLMIEDAPLIFIMCFSLSREPPESSSEM